MEKLQIRRACLEDAPALVELNSAEMGYAYPLDQTRERLEHCLSNPQHWILVAVWEEKVVGYVHAHDYDLLYAPPMKDILGIAVSSSFRRRGIGRRLLKEVEQWARESGAQGIRLVSGISRTEAHAFYRSCGFTGEKKQLNFKWTFA